MLGLFGRRWTAAYGVAVWRNWLAARYEQQAGDFGAGWRSSSGESIVEKYPCSVHPGAVLLGVDEGTFLKFESQEKYSLGNF